MLLTLLTSAALACAGLVHEEGLEAESAAQEAIIDRDGDTTTITYRVTFEGDAPDFGWLIPLPGTFVGLADADTARFDDLREATAPLVWWEEDYEDQGGCGCGGAVKADAGGRSNAIEPDDVAVVAEGFTGTYDYVVLQADDAAALGAWLSDNGWADAGETQVLDAYASDGILTVAALRLEPGDGDGLRELPPVSLTYTGGDARFPSRMGQYAMVAEMRTTVWVVDDQPSETTGWRTVPLDFIGGGTEDDPAALFEAELQEMSGQTATFAQTYVGGWEGRTVTRFDTLAPRAVHTVDAVFVPSESIDFTLEIELVPGRNASLGWLLVGLLPLLWRRRR